MKFATYSLLTQDKLNNCATCSSLSLCLTCEGGFYLKYDKTGCVASCKTDDTNRARDITNTKCVSVCGDGEYFD